jgi:DNA topoisomerase-1
LKKKNDSKEFALGTSKTNYNDPRITVAWCKKNEVRVEKVFTNTHLSKFLWAMYAEPEFEF